MKKKSLIAKRTTVNRINFNKILKDKKILKIYKVFENNLKILNNPNKIAISVSGGQDSLALCFLASCYKFNQKNNIKTFFYLVDHRLRKNSSTEAKLVKKKLVLKKINLNILKWKGKKPNSNLQSLARQNRYKLLFQECKKFNIKTILTAHHKDDVYETFFSRLLRGSGTEGLSSFLEIEKKFQFNGKTITLARPLLYFNKKDLLYVTKKVFNFYIDDPSNKMEKFQRARIRKLIIGLKKEGLDFKKLNLTLNNLSSTNKAINEIVNNNISKNVSINNKKYLISSNFFLYPDEIVFRSLSIIIKKISKKEYPPRGRKITNLINEIKRKNHFRATLGGTLIEKIQNSLVVTEEKTKKKVKFATI